MFRNSIILLIVLLCATALLTIPAMSSVQGESIMRQSRLQSTYTGSETCARCHANTYATFKQTWHANILRPAEEQTILGDFDIKDPDLKFKRDDVDWVLGGKYKQRYLKEIDGELFVLLAEWNIVTEEWAAYATGEWAAYEGTIWRNRSYGKYCAGCHTTGYDPVTQTWIEPGVGCEACHGPGADHVASTGNRTNIINPANLNFQEQVEVCAQCHSRGKSSSGQFPYPVGYFPGSPARLSETFILSSDIDDFWPDGTAKRHHMQYQDWRQGAHQNSVGCIFCHTSHSIGETDHQTRMIGNDRCLVCHESQSDLATHIPFMANAVDKVNCTDCHMPQVSKFVPTDFQNLNHTFHPPNPSLSISYGGFKKMPNACNLCHEDKSPEWAAAVLGQEIPPADATRVPPPTPIPVPTNVAPPADESIDTEAASLNLRSDHRNLWFWFLGVAVLIGGLGILWARRRSKTA